MHSSKASKSSSSISMISPVSTFLNFIVIKYQLLSLQELFNSRKEKKDSDFTLSLQSLFFIDPIFEIWFPVYYTHFMHVQLLLPLQGLFDSRKKKRKGWDCTNRLNVTISFPIPICIDGTLTESFSHNRPCFFRELVNI